MGFDVGQELPHPHKTHPTLGTEEAFLQPVNLLVPGEDGAADVTFAAFVADVRLQSSVAPLVLGQVGAADEALGAFRTWVRLLPGVDPLMDDHL